MDPFDRQGLATYLHYGYLPQLEADHRQRPWARVRRADVAPLAGLRRSELVERGVQAFRSATAGVEGSTHVVPLSGGVDSRLILAALLEHGLRERIVTFTFGQPGTYDFDIAPQVARAAGVAHEAVDLSRVPLGREALLEAVHEAPGAFPFEVRFNRLVHQRFGRAATYWSGSMANTLGGADLDVPCPDWPSACREFATRTRFARSTDLTPPGFHPESALPERPLLEDSPLTGFDQLFLFLRYPGRNDPVMLPPGHDVRTPFREPAWVDFILRVPDALRVGEGLYRAIAQRTSPALFALPLKNRLGFPLHTPAWRVQLRRARLRLERDLRARLPALIAAPDPKRNYTDIDRDLRQRADLRPLVEGSLQRLVGSGLVDWLDPLALWDRHLRRRANHGDALTLLTALELRLAAARRGSGVRSAANARP